MLFFNRNKLSYRILEGKIRILETQLSDATNFIKEVEQGNLKKEIIGELNSGELGNALLSMRRQLILIAEDEQKRSWVNVGLAQFSEILRNQDSLSFNDLTDKILKTLINYVDANQGAIYILDEDECLNMIACYAYNRKKYLNKKIELGEGLNGQCVLEKDSIYLTDIPQDYLEITSGLGAAKPSTLLISPLMINESVFGVLEIAAFRPFEPYQREFIQKMSESIASSIKNIKDSEKNLALLNASQQQAEELRSQEEEMRQNIEEMQATQEEVLRKNEEIGNASAEMKSILGGINATMAMIEFLPNGTIVSANDNFLKVMNYSLSQIKGKHHRMFVSQEISESKDYKDFWTNLAFGQNNVGIFKRLDASGKNMWLNAIYNPILNSKGEVVKVIKFATDITLEQETLAYNQGLITGIDATMATIEFLPDGCIVNANENFLKATHYALSQIKGQRHRIFVPKEISESEEYNSFWTDLASGISKTGVFKRIDADGKAIWLNAIYNPIKDANGKVARVVKFATDITLERAQEEEIKALLEQSQAQEEEIRQNLEEIQATQELTEKLLGEKTLDLQIREEVFGITTILSEADLYGNITFANKKLEEVSKYTAEELKGKPHNIFRHSDMPKELFRLFWETLKDGKVFKGIIKNTAKDGTHYWVDGCFVPVKDTHGKVVKYIGARHHITNDEVALSLYNQQALILGMPILK